MKRKLIKQGGGGGLTVYLPKKWIDAQGLKGGDEVEIEEEDSKLMLSQIGVKKQVKRAKISLDFEHFNIYRSIIGGLFRGGYDEIKVGFRDPKAIPVLQKTVDFLYGFEIFDIDEESCVIRSVYHPETSDIKPHITRMFHTIITMQTIIADDIRNRKYDSKEELFAFRNNVLKQRDVVARTITQQKLFDNKHFPYYLLSFNLWNIARNYYNMYLFLLEKPRISESHIKVFEKTNAFFKKVFHILEKHELHDKHKEYNIIKREAMALMKNKKDASLMASYCLNILMLMQSSNSHILMLNF
jgi:phosphate uptake regulator